jgi:ankyrin repeat protein
MYNKDPYGYTAVHFAAQRNHVQALQALLAAGALPDGPPPPPPLSSSSGCSQQVGGGVCVSDGDGASMLSRPPRVCKATPLHRAGAINVAAAVVDTCCVVGLFPYLSNVWGH